MTEDLGLGKFYLRTWRENVFVVSGFVFVVCVGVYVEINLLHVVVLHQTLTVGEVVGGEVHGSRLESRFTFLCKTVLDNASNKKETIDK